MDGPAFSTRAESEFNRRNGFDVIGMTNLPEAKLAREAEIAFATMAMITDYDCWKVEEEAVSAQTVLGHLTGKCGNGEESLAGCDSANPDRAELAGTYRVGFSAGHRPQALAGSNGRKVEADFGAVSVATALRSNFSDCSQAGRYTVSFNRLAERSDLIFFV